MQQTAMHNKQVRQTRKVRRENGQSIIEFALIVPMLFLMLVGVVYIAQGFNLQLVMSGAAFEGAKVWAKGQPGSGFKNCTPPLCNATTDEGKLNFEAYVMPAVKRYLSNSGFDGAEVCFFIPEGKQVGSFQRTAEIYDNDREKVVLRVLYPYQLPVGNFASGYQQIWVSATCVMKRGS
jgi:TadE-like protein